MTRRTALAATVAVVPLGLFYLAIVTVCAALGNEALTLAGVVAFGLMCLALAVEADQR